MLSALSHTSKYERTLLGLGLSALLYDIMFHNKSTGFKMRISQTFVFGCIFHPTFSFRSNGKKVSSI